MITKHKNLVGKGMLLPFILITLLFFLWGFARSILDVLNRHFQETLSISIARSTLVQGSTYLAYALIAIPAGILITRFGYRRGIVAGLTLFALGALLFLPGASYNSFGIYLTALFIIGCGLAFLETAANPYITELGPAPTAASRLNLSQSFNGLGSILGPITIGAFLFSSPNAGIHTPYLFLGGIVAILAIIFTRIPLPEISASALNTAESSDSFRQRAAILLSNKSFLKGFLALFTYEIAEIGINSLFINYTLEQQWLTKLQATAALSFGALLLFMLARLAASAAMTRIAPRKLLAACALFASLASALVAFNFGTLSHVALFAIYAFEAIMFPTIFALTIEKTPGLAKTASSFLMISPLGGAVGTILMGLLASSLSISFSFCIPALAFLSILFYALKS